MESSLKLFLFVSLVTFSTVQLAWTGCSFDRPQAERGDFGWTLAVARL